MTLRDAVAQAIAKSDGYKPWDAASDASRARSRDHVRAGELLAPIRIV